MSENLVFECTINNRTQTVLTVQDHRLDWGKWTDRGNHEPVEIPARREIEAFRTSGRQGSASGTTGTVIYQLGGDKSSWIKIYWDVPWAPGSANTLNIETSDPDILAAQHGFVGSGNAEAVTLTVADIRDA